MKTKRVIWLSLLIVTLMFVSQALATLETLLPSSSLYEGYTYYGEEIDNGDGTYSYMQGRIDFAVYDTQAGNEWAEESGFENPGDGQYVYAYQIFNDYEGYSEVPIESFSIFGLDGAQISLDEASIDAKEDPMANNYQEDYDDQVGTSFTDNTTVTWDFDYAGLDCIIEIDEHSFFLIFSSNAEWTAGDYSINAYDPDVSVPGGDVEATSATDSVVSNSSNVPEPITVALLGVGGLIAALKRKRI